MNRRQIARVWVDNHAVYAETTNGLQASYEFDLWPRLLQADDKQRRNFELYLRQMNITSKTMYPGLDGLARSMSCLRESFADYKAD